MQLLSGHVTPYFCENHTSIQKSANEVHPQFNPAALFTYKFLYSQFQNYLPVYGSGSPTQKKWRVPDHVFFLTPEYLRSTGSLFYSFPLAEQL
jgi:hypothetical protein